MRLGIVGTGLAGTLLAWRLSNRPYGLAPELFAGLGIPGGDATDASGGLTRAFELDPAQCLDAAESAAELLADPMLREWADYREVGSAFALPHGVNPVDSMEIACAAVPGSLQLAKISELPRCHPLRQCRRNATLVLERHAGYISPAQLRARALAALRAKGVQVRPAAVSAVRAGPVLELADGTVIEYDRVVLAVGPWTPTLLGRSGIPSDGLRTKQIQYVISPTALPGVGAFVDATSGLYGRPHGTRMFLLGLPCDRWDVEPDGAMPDLELASRVLDAAHPSMLCRPHRRSLNRVVAAADCYTRPPGLRLRKAPGAASVYTFTGGSGFAAKAVLAASRRAASQLAADD